jgi:hypothetical protein
MDANSWLWDVVTRSNFVSRSLGIWRGYCRLSRTSPCDPNRGWLFRRPKLTISCSVEGKEGTCFHSLYVTSSLTTGRVCSLQLMLGLSSTVILRSDSPNLEGQVPAFISPRHSSPPTTRRATVEVFDTASTRALPFWLDSHWIFYCITSGPSDSKYLSFPYPRKCVLITRATYPSKCLPLTDWFLWIHLHGNGFVNSFPSNGSTLTLFILFAVYLTTSPITLAILHRVLGWLMNNSKRRMKRLWLNFRYYPRICLGRLKEKLRKASVGIVDIRGEIRICYHPNTSQKLLLQQTCLISVSS